MRRFGDIALAVAFAVVASIGCTERADRIRLEQVPPPPGGTAETITALETDDGPHLVAAMQQAVVVRGSGEASWTRHRAEWPVEWKHSATTPLADMYRGGESFTFAARQRFVSHDGRLWMLTVHRPSGQLKLLVSADRGRSWSTAPLPGRHQVERARGSSSRSAPLSRLDARVPLRLSDRGEQGLYLLDKRRVWRADFSEENRDLKGWNAIDRSGLETLEPTSSTSLPTLIRNYLPASEDRPYELLTVFGDRLHIYRRHKTAERWILVSTLPTVDLALEAPAGSGSLYLLTPGALYRSSKRGEQWQRLPIRRPPDSAPRNRAIAFVERADAPAPFPRAILVGTYGGAIYRSTDGGSSWARVRPADPDLRAITGLVVEPESRRIWASTAGEGVLVSPDGGASWSRSNKNLRATRPLAIGVGLNEELVLGTRAGLFRLTGAPEDGHWNPYHQRAASAVDVDADTSRIVSGTLGGSLVTERSSGELVVNDPPSPSGRNMPLFQPWRAPSILQGKRAVLAVESRPESNVFFAWSRKNGLVVSRDGGLTWRRLTLNKSFLSALEGTLVDNFAVDTDERLYLTSHGFKTRDPDQIWRSPNAGDTWHAIHSFAQKETRIPVLIRRRDSDPPGTLFLARGDRLARTTDGGETWSALEGPWRSGTIRAHSVRNARHTIVYDLSHSSRVAYGREQSPASLEIRGYTLVWPGRQVRPHSGVRDTVTIGRITFLMTDNALYAGSIPKGETQLPHAPTIIALLIVIVFLTALSFWYLRFEVHT